MQTILNENQHSVRERERANAIRQWPNGDTLVELCVCWHGTIYTLSVHLKISTLADCRPFHLSYADSNCVVHAMAMVSICCNNFLCLAQQRKSIVARRIYENGRKQLAIFYTCIHAIASLIGMHTRQTGMQMS